MKSDVLHNLTAFPNDNHVPNTAELVLSSQGGFEPMAQVQTFAVAQVTGVVALDLVEAPAEDGIQSSSWAHENASVYASMVLPAKDREWALHG